LEVGKEPEGEGEEGKMEVSSYNQQLIEQARTEVKKPELWTKYNQFMRASFVWLQQLYETNFLQGFDAFASPASSISFKSVEAEVVTEQNQAEVEKEQKPETDTEPQPNGQDTAAPVSVPPKPSLGAARIIRKYRPELWEQLKKTGFPFETIIGEMKWTDKDAPTSILGVPTTHITNYDIPSYRSFVEEHWEQIIGHAPTELYTSLIELIKATNTPFIQASWETLVEQLLLLDAQYIAENLQGFVPTDLKLLEQYLHFEKFLLDPYLRYTIKHLLTGVSFSNSNSNSNSNNSDARSDFNSTGANASSMNTNISGNTAETTSAISPEPAPQPQSQPAQMNDYDYEYEQWDSLLKSARARLRVAEDKLRGHAWCGIELEEGYEIRYPLSSDITLYSQDPVKSLLLQGDYSAPAFLTPLVEVEVSLPKTKPDLSNYHSEANNVLLALRLFRPEAAIGMEPLAYYVNEYPELLMQIPRYKFEAEAGMPLVLSLQDAKEFDEFWQELRAGLLSYRFKGTSIYWQQHQARKGETATATATVTATTPVTEPNRTEDLEVAVDRFWSSYEHYTGANQLLDIVIGIESIFSEGAESISYKQALRAALATGRDEEERLTTFSLLKKTYSMRNNIAHGNTPDKKSQVQELILPTRAILARGIIRAARWIRDNPNTKFKKDFIGELDTYFLKTDNYPFWSVK
jgi:hypothetical protein